jgi:hypothetical protein
MAGSISATTALALATLGVGAAGTGAAIYQGAKSASRQKQALQNQTTATEQAESGAFSTERQNQTATNAANMKQPNIADIMARAAQASKGGVGSTMLTGPGGVNPGSLSLGKSTLLGS